MSVKCPYCGSTAQTKETGVFYQEDERRMTVTRFYSCGCGESFSRIAVYQNQDVYEDVKPIGRSEG